LIVSVLFADSFSANFEGRRFFDVPKTSSHTEVVFNANAVGAAFTVVAISVTGELSTALESLGVKRVSAYALKGGLRGWEFCPFCPFFATFSTFTKIPQVPSFRAHSPVKTVFRQNPKNARKSQNTPSTNPYQNETQF
jgi:hypothetical protein